MRVRWSAWRWVVLVALALGVVLMHHAPIAHGAHSSAAHTVSAAHHAHAAVSVAPEPACGCEADHAASAVPGDSTPGSHSLLHLCLAIMTAAATAVAGLWLSRMLRPCALSLTRPPSRQMREQLRPPIPVPRRLAVLCVLRL